MSYRNPKAAPINTGAAVYEGINKLAGDVLSFANKERDRKGQLIADSLADSQAVDDNINKAGIKTSKDGSTGLANQLPIITKEVKNKMGVQYDILNRTFSSPSARAAAKAELAKLKKYPEELASEMAMGQYLVNQWNESKGKKNGTIGSISLSNDLDVMGVIKDLQSGGSNTTIEDKDGGRVLVTKTSEGETFKLNISDITQSLKANPEQSLFKKVVDDKADVDMYMSQLGFGKGVTKETLISNKYLKRLGKRTIAGKEVEVFGMDNDRLAAAAGELSKDLVDDNDNYVYASSIWQDHMGENGTIKEAIEATSREEVLGKIQDHYIKKATKQAELNLGFTIGLPDSKNTDKVDEEYRRDKQLDNLALGKSKGGVQSVKIGDVNYYITLNEASVTKDSSERDRMLAMYVTPQVPNLEAGVKDEHDVPKKEYIQDEDKQFRLWLVDPRETENKILPLIKNYPAWRSATNDLTLTKLAK